VNADKLIMYVYVCMQVEEHGWRFTCTVATSWPTDMYVYRSGVDWSDVHRLVVRVLLTRLFDTNYGVRLGLMRQR